MAAQKARMSRSAGMALILFGLPAIAGITAGQVQDHQSAKLQRTADALYFETQSLTASRPELADYEPLRRALILRSAVLDHLAQDRFVLADLMELLSSAPEAITLRSMSLEHGQLDISGSAGNEDAIGALVSRMRKLPVWRDIAIETEAADQGKPTTFHLAARLANDSPAERKQQQ